MKPQRIQLSRKKGFNLQVASRALNGLAAVNVARPSKWGNPFSVENNGRCMAVYHFEQWWKGRKYPGLPKPPIPHIGELRGKNLACYCDPKDGLPCHADFLLDISNA